MPTLPGSDPLLHKPRRDPIHRETQKVANLRGEDDDGDATGEPHGDRIGNEPEEHPHSGEAHEDQHAAGEKGCHGQPFVAVAVDHTIDYDDERAGGTADLRAATTQGGDHETGHDRGVEPLLGLDS